jgi:hypothetical protein
VEIKNHGARFQGGQVVKFPERRSETKRGKGDVVQLNINARPVELSDFAEARKVVSLIEDQILSNPFSALQVQANFTEDGMGLLLN